MKALNRRAALTALAGAAAAVPAISLAATAPAETIWPGEIASKARCILSATAASGDAELFAAIVKYESLRAVKWSVYDRESYTDDEVSTAADAEFDAFSAVADFPATTLAGVLAKMLLVIEDMDEPGDDNFGNHTCTGEHIAESLIGDLARLDIEWTPNGHPMTGQRELTDAAEDWIERAIQRGDDPVVVIQKDHSFGLYRRREIAGATDMEPLDPGSRLFTRICFKLMDRGRVVQAEALTGGAA